MSSPAKPHPKNTSATTAAAAPPSPSLDSDFVVILAALLCALICVVGLVAVARCAWARRRPSGPVRANKGLKKKALHSLPKLTYAAASAAAGKLTSDCAICLTEFAEGDEIRVLPQCGHGFHVGCVDTWLGSHSSCPSCRRLLVSRCKNCASSDLEAGLKPTEDVADCHRDQNSNPQ